MKTSILNKSNILLVLLLLSWNLIAQTKVTKTYEFPIKLGSEKWRNLSSSKEMLKVCQIPMSVMQNMSTKALAESCLNYPLFFEYTASNDERWALNVMIENFNGLGELVKREDAMSELIKLYKELPLKTETTSKIKADNLPYKVMYLEMLLANSKFIDKAKKKELETLKKILQEKYEEKLQNLNIYSLYNIRKTLLLGAVVYLKQNSSKSTKSTKDNTIESFIKNFNFIDKKELSTISKIIMQ